MVVRSCSMPRNVVPSTAKTVRDLARDVEAGRSSPVAPYGPERFRR